MTDNYQIVTVLIILAALSILLSLWRIIAFLIIVAVIIFGYAAYKGNTNFLFEFAKENMIETTKPIVNQNKGLPELSIGVLSPQFLSPVRCGTVVNLVVAIRNTGNAPAYNVKVICGKVYKHIRTLNPNQQIRLPFNFQLIHSNSKLPNKERILFSVDPNNEINELIESNNFYEYIIECI